MNLKSLVARLNPQTRNALEGAAALTLSRTNYDVEPEHWLLRLAEDQSGDVAAILAHFECDTGRLTAQLNGLLEKLKTGNGRAPALSPRLVRWAREAWLDASIDHEEEVVRSGHLLTALLADRELGGAIREAAPELRRIRADVLAAELGAITRSSSESSGSERPVGASESGLPAARGTKALDT